MPTASDHSTIEEAIKGDIPQHASRQEVTTSAFLVVRRNSPE